LHFDGGGICGTNNLGVSGLVVISKTKQKIMTFFPLFGFIEKVKSP
jgi:hypothetical protein